MTPYSIKKFASYVRLAGIAVLLAAIFGGGYEYRNFSHVTDSADGTIVDFYEVRTGTTGSTSSRSTISYAPVVRFTTRKGEIVRFSSDTSSDPSRYSKGEHVKVLYDPSSPQNAKIYDFFSVYLTPIIIGGIGLFFILLGSAIIMVQSRRPNKGG